MYKKARLSCDIIFPLQRRNAMRIAPKIVLSSEEEKVLRKLAGGRSCSVRLAQRSTIVLLAANGLENCKIAAELVIDRGTVSRWRHRYFLAGLKGIEKDASRPGRRPSISPAKVSEVIKKTTQSKPEDATHWSRRTMAAEVGISAASVGRIWKRNGLKPHLARTFKVSNDPNFSALPQNLWVRNPLFSALPELN